MAHPSHIAHELLSEAHPADIASALFTDKVLHKPLHLRPTSPDPSSQDARARRRLQRLRANEKKYRRQKPKPLSAKEKRVKGIYDIPDHCKKYTIYLPLHEMWLGYMWEILGMNEGKQAFITANIAGSKLASAEYHGAEVLVVRSRCVGMVGLQGIIIRDTKFTFQIITKEDKLKTVPKRFTVFRFEIPQREPMLETKKQVVAGQQHGAEALKESFLIFEVQGTQFESRATDRATKKFKQKILPDL